MFKYVDEALRLVVDLAFLHGCNSEEADMMSTIADPAEYIFGVLRPVKHGDMISSAAQRAANHTPTPARIQRRNLRSQIARGA